MLYLWQLLFCSTFAISCTHSQSSNTHVFGNMCLYSHHLTWAYNSQAPEEMVAILLSRIKAQKRAEEETGFLLLSLCKNTEWGGRK